MSTVVASPLSGRKTPLPGKNLAVANLAGANRIAEKTIELTACAQLGNLLRRRMVWFGLTQAQEREHAYDAATNLGGRAFYIQFKSSTKVLKNGKYGGRRLFQCQHEQMSILVEKFGSVRNSCFYFLPNLGTIGDLQSVAGNLIDNSYLIDVADIPNPVPATGRQSDHHYVYLDAQTHTATVTSDPFEVRGVIKVSDLLGIAHSVQGLQNTRDLLQMAGQILDGNDRKHFQPFYKNAAIVLLPD